MNINITQFDWTHGEFSPLMIARGNLKIYQKGAKRLRNVLVLPQGALTKRYGTKFIADLTGQAASGEYMMESFQFDSNIFYLLVFIDLQLLIYKDGVLVKTLVTPFAGTLLKEKSIGFSQSGNSFVITHEDTAPLELRRGATDADWTLTTIVFKHLPVYDFDNNYDAISFSLSATDVGDNRTLTASSPIFSVEYVGGLFEGYGESLDDGLGRARITSYGSPTSVEVSIISPFAGDFTSSTIDGLNCFLGIPAWSATKGWPLSVDYYEGRLFFGGSKALPQTLFGSVVDAPFNFDVGRGLDSDGLQLTLQKSARIKYLIGDKNLQVFTSNDTYVSLQLQGNNLTPTHVPFRKQTASGISTVEPVILDNQTFFVERGGKRVMSYVFNDNQSAYQANEVSTISDHLIRNPIDSAVFKDDLSNSANFFTLVNNDGTLAIFQTLIAENVMGWTLSDTDGYFKAVTAVDNILYFIIEREIDGETKQYLEVYEADVYMDCSKSYSFGTPQDYIDGLEYLEGKSIWVIGDGYNLGEFTVSSGRVDLLNEISAAVVGLFYKPIIETLPVDIQTQTGDQAYKRKRISKVRVDYYESLGIYIEDILVPFREFLETFNYPPATPVTGWDEISLIKGWEPRQTITITQNEPLPMTILALNIELEVQ